MRLYGDDCNPNEEEDKEYLEMLKRKFDEAMNSSKKERKQLQDAMESLGEEMKPVFDQLSKRAVRNLESNHVCKNETKPLPKVILSGRPNRTKVISKEDILNLRILLESTKTVTEFLEKVS